MVNEGERRCLSSCAVVFALHVPGRRACQHSDSAVNSTQQLKIQEEGGDERVRTAMANANASTLTRQWGQVSLACSYFYQRAAYNCLIMVVG